MRDRWPLWPVGLAIVASLASIGGALAVEARTGAYEEGRATSGIRLFRAMLVADTELARRTDSGSLRLLVVHLDAGEWAKNLAEMLALRDASGQPEPLRSLPVRVEVLTIEQLAADKRPAAGVFVAERLGRDQVDRLVRLAIDRRVLVYSPYEGDVERGVPGGLSVEAQVRPMVNTRTLQAAGIVLKDFFLKVAKVHP